MAEALEQMFSCAYRRPQQALKKSPEERRWVIVIDLRKCVGCHACTCLCRRE
jgi:molybdopterin-containing oxidoreductase family iron-sulfur binding subunit